MPAQSAKCVERLRAINENQPFRNADYCRKTYEILLEEHRIDAEEGRGTGADFQRFSDWHDTAYIAEKMKNNGAILSEYLSDTNLEKGNFPSRNRIVAGISDATIVVETDLKGGSMITAELAFSYNRELYCFPGNIYDSKSAGCNYLIKKLKHLLLHDHTF